MAALPITVKRANHSLVHREAAHGARITSQRQWGQKGDITFKMRKHGVTWPSRGLFSSHSWYSSTFRVTQKISRRVRSRPSRAVERACVNVCHVCVKVRVSSREADGA
ncbi:hypothetical protein NDU88_009847 [Pleurodeles waltl]|uniref:Uncharacterized protein n=1 Tax=Pleurodeles waltl TaxID=8319 RepID=A0AAV7RZJ5_PLEWA|nr:hypothetical protein NDU88_009847 [Pleurodeles waltl]